MALTEQQKKAKREYRKKLKTVSVEFYPATEKELIERIDAQPNKSGYIKELIRKDINEGRTQ